VVERNLLAIPGRGLWIADLVETDRPRCVRWFWQLPAGTVRRVPCDGTAASIFEGDDVVLAIWSDSVPVEARVESPNETAPTGWHAFGYGTLRQGQRVCHEAEAATRLLLVTYVGRSPVPVEVSVKGRRAICTLRAGAESPTGEIDGGTETEWAADVVWRVFPEQEDVTYVAGSDPVAAEMGRHFLKGAGDWSVRFVSCSTESARCQEAFEAPLS